MNQTPNGNKALQTTQPVPTQALIPRAMGALERIGGETAASAVAEQARAVVQARYIMAAQRPRNWDEVRTQLIKDCFRPSFARVARYHKPVGKDGIVGFSIRFAETAARWMGNIAPSSMVVFDDRLKRIIRVDVTDYESNVTYSTDVVLEKTVERKSSKDRQVLDERVNSFNEKVFIVVATEDELLNKANAAISKAVRTGILRLLPGDLLDECALTVQQIRANAGATDPDAERRRIIDMFGALGVFPRDLEIFLGHPMASTSPREFVQLEDIATGIREGESTWSEVLAATLAERGGRPETVAPAKVFDARVEAARRATSTLDADDVPDFGAAAQVAEGTLKTEVIKPAQTSVEAEPHGMAPGPSGFADLTGTPPTTFAELGQALALAPDVVGLAAARGHAVTALREATVAAEHGPLLVEAYVRRFEQLLGAAGDRAAVVALHKEVHAAIKVLPLGDAGGRLVELVGEKGKQFPKGAR